MHKTREILSLPVLHQLQMSSTACRTILCEIKYIHVLKLLMICILLRDR